MTKFHSDDYIRFLRNIRPDNMSDYNKQMQRCKSRHIVVQNLKNKRSCHGDFPPKQWHIILETSHVIPAWSDRIKGILTAFEEKNITIPTLNVLEIEWVVHKAYIYTMWW